ncbi:MAG TPA: hypothetical protein DCE41_21555 [Cytophagales bacterium]|nr:hypothetical protein [Cytophagales bacterium]
MSKAKGAIEIIKENPSIVEHGDYQRIANLTAKSDGKKYTADYVRKVLKELRKNDIITDIATLYFKNKIKYMERLKENVRV